MKQKSFYAAFILFAVTLSRCAENEDLNDIGQLSDEVRTFLAMRLNRASQFESVAASLINRSFNTVSGNYSGNGRIESDSALISEPWGGEPCAVFTETENEDGSLTIIRDYGDGCQVGQDGFEYWMFGRLTETFRYIHRLTGTRYRSEYFSHVDYDHYGGRYSDDYTWIINGITNYNGWSEWDTITYQFNGSFTENSNLISKYGDWEYSYSSEGVSHFDDSRWEQASGGFYQYAEGDNFYRSDILKKLVMRFDCTSDDRLVPLVWGMTYVSGLEKISYCQNGKTGEFMIDYGNGECDNLIYIIENGKRIRIKVDSLWTIFSGG